VELPLKTQASPLIAMINEGTLPIRSPGWHDIRHRTATTPNHHTGGSSK
jgi:hypothetical protein